MMSLIVGASLLGSQAVEANALEDRPVARSITVVGAGEATAKPDMAEIQIGVTTQAQSAAEALKTNNAAMSQLLKTLSARGIAEKDVQTSNLSVAPQYRHEQPGREQPVISSYQATNQVRVRVRQLPSVGEVIDVAVGQGANQVHGINFRVAEPEPLLDAARKDAVADARRKAELYAAAAGVKVGRVLVMQEQSARGPQPQVMSFGRDSASTVPVASGELEFRASITVTYAIE